YDERPQRATLDGAAVAPPVRPSKSTILGVGATTTHPSEPPRRPSEPPRAGPPRPVTRPAPPPRPPRPSADATAPARPAALAPSSSRPTHPSEPPPRTPGEPPRPARPLYLDEKEPVVPARPRSRSGLWVALVVLLAAGVGVALGWPQIAPTLGLAEAPDPARPHVEAGDRALAEDTLAGYERALLHYTQALAYAEHDPRVLTGLSRAQALWAQSLAFDASDLEARADEDPALRGEAAAIRREAQRRAESALQRAEDAVRHGSGDPDAEVALADALRLTGDVPRARSRLDRALTLRSRATAETLRVSALIRAAERGGDLAAAREEAEQAVAADPTSIRARLLLARAHLAERDVGAARRQIEAVLARSAQHPAAVALRAAIDEGRPPAPPTVDVPDAGVAEAPEPEVAPEPEPAPAARGGEAPRRGGSAAAGGDDSGPIPTGRDYGWYIRQGDERLERGDVERARAYYEAARTVRASGSEALTGLGYVALESGDASGAAAKFRQAAGQGYAEAYIGLGQAYRRMGRREDAITAFQRYIERLPGGPRASFAQRQIDELRAQGGEPAAPEPQPAPEPPATPEPATPPAPEPATPPAPEPAPPTPEGALPAPRGADAPPPRDVPDIESDPELR
ncbi:MAG TPA: tetratricopeptide repeat protein, partial [Sandaracinaceae bacterium]